MNRRGLFIVHSRMCRVLELDRGELAVRFAIEGRQKERGEGLDREKEIERAHDVCEAVAKVGDERVGCCRCESELVMMRDYESE